MQIVKKDTSFILAIKFLFLTPLLRLFLMFMMVAIAPLDSFAKVEFIISNSLIILVIIFAIVESRLMAKNQQENEEYSDDNIKKLTIYQIVYAALVLLSFVFIIIYHRFELRLILVVLAAILLLGIVTFLQIKDHKNYLLLAFKLLLSSGLAFNLLFLFVLQGGWEALKYTENLSIIFTIILFTALLITEAVLIAKIKSFKVEFETT